MPRIPTYDTQPLQPTIRQGEARPVLGVEQAAMPGRQIQETGEAMGRVGSALGQYVLQQQEIFNRARTNDIANTVQRTASEMLAEYQNLRGAQALENSAWSGQDGATYYNGQFQRRVQEALDQAPNAVVRQALSEQLGNIYARFDDNTRRHMLNEGRAFAVSTAEATISLTTDAFQANPEAPDAALQLDRLRTAANDLGAVRGLAGESLSVFVSNLENAALSTVLKGLLDGDRIPEAERLLRNYGNRFTEAGRVEAQNDLNRVGAAYYGMQIADEVARRLPIRGDAGGGQARDNLARELSTVDGVFRDDRYRRAVQEINRRETQARQDAAQWRAVVASRIDEDAQRLSLGLEPVHNVSIQTVRNALGEAAALRYEAQQTLVGETAAMRGMRLEDLSTIARTPLAGDDVRSRTVQAARQQAAIAELQARGNPAEYAVASGFLSPGARPEDLAQALNTGDMDAAGMVIQARITHLAAQAPSLGTEDLVADQRTPLLTSAEADGMRTALDALSPSDRVNALATMRASTDGGSFDRVMRQVYAERPASALAGHIAARETGEVRRGSTAVTAQTAARRMAQGETLLASDAVKMPTESLLRFFWSDAVGEAYARVPEAAAAGYEAFRAYYAGATADAGDVSGIINQNRAREAALAASGGVYGGETLLPWGMSENQFVDQVRAQWPQIQARGGDAAQLNRNAARFVMQGVSSAEGPYAHRYQVMVGEAAVLDANGDPIFLTVQVR